MGQQAIGFFPSSVALIFIAHIPAKCKLKQLFTLKTAKWILNVFFLACDNGCVCLFGRPWFSFSGRQSIQCCYALKTSESSKRWLLISMHLHRESIPLSALCSFLCICEFRFMYSCTFALLHCNWNLSQSNYRHFAPLTSILLSSPTTRRNVPTIPLCNVQAQNKTFRLLNLHNMKMLKI